jgi:lysozyme
VSKLGAYVQHNTDAAWSWISRAQPKVVKWSEWDSARLQAVHSWGGINIGRIINLAQDVASTVEQITAQDQAFPGLFDYWELVNEPTLDQSLNDYTVAVVSALKRPLLVGVLGEGNPANLADWNVFYPAMRLAQQYGGGLALHEYGYPNLQQSAPWHIGRFALSLMQFPPDLKNIPIFITELGIDGALGGKPGNGWMTVCNEAGYLSQLQWYDTLIGSYQNVIGANIFVCGDYPPWSTFEIQMTTTIADYIRESNMTYPYTYGIDVSNLNGPVDWSTVARCGPQFAVIKATEGTYFKDGFFLDNWNGAKANGLVRGAYCFARPSQASGHADAAYFLSTVENILESGDFLALDLEDTNLPETADLHAYALDWLQTVQNAVGFRPFLYTGHWYSGPHNIEDQSDLEQFGLWQASYQITIPDPLHNWQFWAMWQFTSQGVIPGINHATDLDLFNGSLAQLKLYGKP